jgi:glutathione S-transferase
MSYTLIGSTTSPYVRKIRLCLFDVIIYDFKTINYLEKNDADYLKSLNPINKIPILLDNQQAIYDSRVIYNYLAKKYQWTPLSIQQENILSAIDGAMDTSINLFSLKRGGLDLSTSTNSYITRQLERLPLILHFLSPWAKANKEWNFVSMSLYSFLDWAAFREVIDLNHYPEMKTFLETNKNAPGVQETKIVA